MSKAPLDFYATTAPGLEAISAAELDELGCTIGPTDNGGVAFSGPLKDALRVHLHARTLVGVRLRLAEFRARDFPELFKKAGRVSWQRYVHPGAPLDIQASSKGSRLFHTRRIRETVLDAIQRSLPEQKGASTESNGPPQKIFARLVDNRCLLSIDMSGDRLHQRGYRSDSVAAPLRETMAAAILRHLAWQPDEALLDPMCGSGTFPIEAAQRAAGILPGASRSFAFERWPSLTPEELQPLRQAASSTPHGQARIWGSDIDPKAVAAAQSNAERAGCADMIRWQQLDVAELEPPAERGLVLCNAPFGQRLGTPDSLTGLYRTLGERFRRFVGWRSALLYAQPKLRAVFEQSFGAKASSSIAFLHGGRRVRLSCYDAPEG